MGFACSCKPFISFTEVAESVCQSQVTETIISTTADWNHMIYVTLPSYVYVFYQTTAQVTLVAEDRI